MIQNISATPSRQNFGTVKYKEDFPEKLATKSKKMQDAFTQVQTDYNNIKRFDLHLDFDEKDKLQMLFKDNHTGKEIDINKDIKGLRGLFLSFFPDDLKLKIIHMTILDALKSAVLKSTNPKMLKEQKK